MTYRILAIDGSMKRTGWAFGSPTERPTYGSLRFAEKNSSPDKVWWETFLWVNKTIKDMSPDVVALEAAIGGSSITDSDGKPITNPNTTGILWGIQSTIRMVVQGMAELGRVTRPTMLIHASTARKFLTGRGTYPKDEAKPAVWRRCLELGWIDERANYDESDALCVWACAVGRVDPTFAANFTPLMTARQKPAPIPMEF